MKTIFTIGFILIFNLPSFSQRDTTASISTSSFTIIKDSVTGIPTLLAIPQRPGQAQPVIVARENNSLAVRNFNLTFVENQIVSLESEECAALKKSDQSTLQRLWGKDFTLNKKQNEVVTSANPLPKYLSFSRLIEKITVIDSNTVFTCGYESYEEFTTGTNTTPFTIRKYFHAWTRTKNQTGYINFLKMPGMHTDEIKPGLRL